MNKSDDISELSKALCTAQPMIKIALMDSTNPFFKSKYADLGAVWDAVRSALECNGLAVSQLPDHIGQEPALTTMLIHKSGQWLSATYPLMVTDKEHTPQGYGSALTYARRYGLSALLGVIADTDDDGNAASRPHKPPVAPTQPPKPDATPAHNGATVTPAQWLENSARAVKTMAREQLDRFTEEQGPRMVRVQTLNPSLHKALMTAIQQRQSELF